MPFVGAEFIFASFVKGDSPVRGNVATRQKGCASLRGRDVEGAVPYGVSLILLVICRGVVSAPVLLFIFGKDDPSPTVYC